MGPPPAIYALDNSLFGYRLILASNPVHMKLRKDCYIFSHRAQAANQPREVLHNVLMFRGMAEDASTICQISQQRQDEEEEGQACQSKHVSTITSPVQPEKFIYIPSQLLSLAFFMICGILAPRYAKALK